MKQSVCLFGILCLMVLEFYSEMPAFANRVNEHLGPRISIEEFVRGVHPHGVSVSAVRKYRRLNLDSNNTEMCIELRMPEITNELVCKLLKMLDDENEKRYWPTIVVTLGLLGDSSAIPGMISFIKGYEKKTDFDRFKSRALSSATWALGIAINEGRKHPRTSPAPPTESGSELDQASNFLIERSGRSSPESKKMIKNRQYMKVSLPPNDEPVSNRKADAKDRVNDIVGNPSILGLAFANTKKTSDELKLIRNKAVGRDRAWLDQVFEAQEKIQKFGLRCYREPESSGC